MWRPAPPSPSSTPGAQVLKVLHPPSFTSYATQPLFCSVVDPVLSVSVHSPAHTLSVVRSPKQTSPLATSVRVVFAAYIRSLTFDADVLISDVVKSSSSKKLKKLKKNDKANSMALNLSKNTRLLVDALDFGEGEKAASSRELRKTLDELFSERDWSSPASPDPSLSLYNLFPNASPVGRLISVLSQRLASLKTIPNMSALFTLFTARLREHFNSLEPIPNIDSVETLDGVWGGDEEGGVDLFQGILAQKIRMIQCCIAAKRESAVRAAAEAAAAKPAPPTVRDRSASEERFRADRKRIISRMKKTTIRAIKSRTDDPDPSPPSSDDDDEFHDASSAPPSPAHRHPSLTVPQRRNRVPPATIDMILQRKQMLSLLGDDREVLLMRLNEPMFKSDAQTFRYQNPGASWELFKRWIDTLPEYTDLDESILLKVEEIYDENEGVAVADQTPLFVSTEEEAEKALNYLESLPVNQLLAQVLSNVLSNAWFVLREAGGSGEIRDEKALHEIRRQIDDTLVCLQAEVEGRDVISEVAENVAVSQTLLDEIEKCCCAIFEYEEELSLRMSTLEKMGCVKPGFEEASRFIRRERASKRGGRGGAEDGDEEEVEGEDEPQTVQHVVEGQGGRLLMNCEEDGLCTWAVKIARA
ncbi:hypothetical protein TeGR_g15142 [Tetraparma gracilis]|uniref:Uncharacterized protein n=1 Tax=Tetraparma gracilis TaxID=2962635 RepID=A0ABQ6N355_9STRA|nr:hypothetical protein TeGR_g15142 [Tetraparma gracilis]